VLLAESVVILDHVPKETVRYSTEFVQGDSANASDGGSALMCVSRVTHSILAHSMTDLSGILQKADTCAP
jgi:hypothetical protein